MDAIATGCLNVVRFFEYYWEKLVLSCACQCGRPGHHHCIKYASLGTAGDIEITNIVQHYYEDPHAINSNAMRRILTQHGYEAAGSVHIVYAAPDGLHHMQIPLDGTKCVRAASLPRTKLEHKFDKNYTRI